VHPPDGLVTPAAFPKPVVQVSQVVRQPFAVSILVDAIHAHRGPLAESSIRALQRPLVDVVGQGAKPDVRVSLRSLHYPQQSC